MQSSDAHEHADPVAVSEALLELSRRAYLADDVDLFQTAFTLPNTVGTFDGDRVIDDPEDFRRIFWTVRDSMKQAGVIDMHRRVIAARFVTPDTIQSTSVTEYILAGYKVSDEIVSHSILVRLEGVWKVRESRYATVLHPFNNAVMPAGTVGEPPRR